jgi:hypothetical protein
LYTARNTCVQLVNKFHIFICRHCFHKNLPLDSVIISCSKPSECSRHHNTVFTEINFNITLLSFPRFKKWVITLMFSKHIVLIYHSCYMYRPSQLSWVNHVHVILVKT